MSSALIFNQYSFASLRLNSVQVRRGLGHAVLLAGLRTHNNIPNANTQNAPRAPIAIHFSGEIRNSDADHIAEIRPICLRWYTNRPEDNIYLHAPISFSALSILNGSRKPGADNIQLTFALTVDMQSKDDWQQQPIEIMHRIASSDWIALLEQARHTISATIEVPLEGASVPAGLAIATSRYRTAIRHLQLCQWDDAVAECRQVIEDASGAIGATEATPPWSQYTEQQRRNWSFSERCGAIRQIIRHATHEAHHGRSEFTALEARYIIELTGILLKFYCGKLHVTPS